MLNEINLTSKKYLKFVAYQCNPINALLAFDQAIAMTAVVRK